MGFGQSISTCFKKYATFSGRARRSEYWWFFLFIVIIEFIAQILDWTLGTTVYSTTTADGSTAFYSVSGIGWFMIIAVVVLFIPALSVSVRRLHDTGRSGWWWLIGLVCCIGSIILLVFYLGDSGPDNEYGPNPKGLGGGLPPLPQA